jgi:hypothetical protein
MVIALFTSYGTPFWLNSAYPCRVRAYYSGDPLDFMAFVDENKLYNKPGKWARFYAS